MRIPDADNPATKYFPSGDQWNAMRDEATRTGRLQVGGRLSLRNTVTGPILSLDDAAVTLVLAIAVKPVEGGGAGAGRTLAKIINGPANPAATGDFKIGNLGEVPEDAKAVAIEVWSLDGTDMPADTPFVGWHIQNRGDDMGGRQIVVPLMGGADRGVWVRLVETAPAGRTYWGVRVRLAATPNVDPNGVVNDVNFDPISDISSVPRVLVVNRYDKAGNIDGVDYSHSLVIGREYYGQLGGRTADGVTVVYLHALEFYDCGDNDSDGDGSGTGDNGGEQ